MTGSRVVIEVAYALPTVQFLVELVFDEPPTIADALESAGIYDQFSGEDFSQLPVGIWGRLATRDQLLKQGDRVELYRPLLIDPREARRRLAELGRTMGQSNSD